MSRPPSSFTARSAVELRSPRMAACCTWIATLFPAAPAAFADSLSCFSVPGSCEASSSLAPASPSATAAARPTARSAPITSAAFPSSENSFNSMDPSDSVGHLRRYAGWDDTAGESAAVDRDQFAVDVVGSVGGEEHRERAEFGVVAGAADRDELAALEELHHLLVMRKDAGHDAVGLDVVLRVGQRHRAGELDDPAFGARVHVVVLAAAKTVAGGEVDYLAAILFDHERDHRTASVELAGQIGVESAAPLRVGDFLQAL